MGLFDTYVPDPPLTCPMCRRILEGWQGKDGPCLLLCWRQGVQQPDKTAVDVDLDSVALPSEFLLYSSDCTCFEHGVEAVGRCASDGVWRSTEYLTAPLVDRFHYALTRAERSARIERLRAAGL
jgi:hypothetical protein